MYLGAIVALLLVIIFYVSYNHSEHLRGRGNLIWPEAARSETMYGSRNRGNSEQDSVDGRDGQLRDARETDYFSRLQKLRSERNGVR